LPELGCLRAEEDAQVLERAIRARHARTQGSEAFLRRCERPKQRLGPLVQLAQERARQPLHSTGLGRSHEVGAGIARERGDRALEEAPVAGRLSSRELLERAHLEQRPNRPTEASRERLDCEAASLGTLVL